MDSQLLSLGFDIVIATLLGTTIIYAFLLNKRLQALRADREEMERLLRKFYDAIQAADLGIKNMKSISHDLGRDLQDRIDKAKSLRDEMAFMLERGDLLANQLESSISSSRPERPQQDLTQLLQAARKNTENEQKNRDLNKLDTLFKDNKKDDMSDVEKELMKALKGIR
jgi:hypothetical protein